MRLSENSNIAGVRISVGDNNKNEVSKNTVKIRVGEIRLKYDVESFCSYGQM